MKRKEEFVERREVTALRRNFPTVHRVRVSDKSIAVRRCSKTGEELWKVGNSVMTESKMLELAKHYM